MTELNWSLAIRPTQMATILNGVDLCMKSNLVLDPFYIVNYI